MKYLRTTFLSTDLQPQQTVPTLISSTLDIIKRGDRIIVKADLSQARLVRADSKVLTEVIHAAIKWPRVVRQSGD